MVACVISSVSYLLALLVPCGIPTDCVTKAHVGEMWESLNKWSFLLPLRMRPDQQGPGDSITKR